MSYGGWSTTGAVRGHVRGHRPGSHDLKVACLEKPDSAVWPDWFEEKAAKVPETGTLVLT